MPGRTKKKLFDVMVTHRIAWVDLAPKCNAKEDVWEMQLGQPLDRADAEKIIEELNTLCGTQYKLDDFDVCLCQVGISNDAFHRIPVCYRCRRKYQLL